MSGTTAGSPPDITKLVKFSNKRPESSGGYCDVFRGTHKTHGVVALKLPRMRSTPENIRRVSFTRLVSGIIVVLTSTIAILERSGCMVWM